MRRIFLKLSRIWKIVLEKNKPEIMDIKDLSYDDMANEMLGKNVDKPNRTDFQKEMDFCVNCQNIECKDELKPDMNCKKIVMKLREDRSRMEEMYLEFLKLKELRENSK
jgi:hypothetical protein